ncbi:hypothetical protein AAMO2058_001192300 [Amorphochlora amoebiformis]
MCLGSCLGSCCASMCCSVVSRMCGWSNKQSDKYSKLPYGILIFLTVLVALVLKNFHQDFGISMYGMSVQVCGESCQGDQAVYRITLAMTIFFAAHAFFVLVLPYQMAWEIHARCFGVKLLIYAGIVASMFFIEKKSASEFAEASRIISLVFLIFQIMVIIDYAYTLHFWMIDRDEDRVKNWEYANLAISGVLICGCISADALLFHWFTEDDNCSIEKFVLSLTIIVPTLFTFASCTDFIPHGALFPSTCVSSYITYLAWTAMISNDNDSCNATVTDKETTWELAIGIVIAAISITFTTWNASSTSTQLFGRQEGEAGADRKLLDPSDEKNRMRMKAYHTYKDEDDQDDQDDQNSENYQVSDELAAKRKQDALIFHILMTFASMYACMLLTSWSTNNYGSGHKERYRSNESFWVKVASQWVVMILYIWTLIAPILFPDRDFS